MSIIARKGILLTMIIMIVNLSVILLLTGIYTFTGGAGFVCLSLLFTLIFDALQLAVVFFYRRLAIKSEESFLTFHDFLIDYRASPRTKMLKRHKPNLDMVIEEESRYEQSQLANSNMTRSI